MAARKPTPNYFLAIRITNEDIRKVFDSVRSRIIGYNSNYKNICINKDCLHLTLCLLSIPDSTQLQAAAKALLEASDELQSMIIPKAILRVAGLSTFNGRVVYANAEFGRDLLVMRSVLISFLDAAGVCVVDEEFTPHVTVAKVTRAFRCREGTNTVDPMAYQDDSETVFGKQTVREVCLCRIGSGRQRDGFYITEAAVRV